MRGKKSVFPALDYDKNQSVSVHQTRCLLGETDQGWRSQLAVRTHGCLHGCWQWSPTLVGGLGTWGEDRSSRPPEPQNLGGKKWGKREGFLLSAGLCILIPGNLVKHVCHKFMKNTIYICFGAFDSKIKEIRYKITEHYLLLGTEVLDSHF